MPRVIAQAANSNLSALGSSARKKVATDVLDKITTVSDLMRDKNNIYIGDNYRLDAKPMSAGGTGFQAGDYKLDIQTVTAQKSQSVTVAVAFLSPNTPQTSLNDVIGAFTDCMANQNIYRVT